MKKKGVPRMKIQRMPILGKVFGKLPEAQYLRDLYALTKSLGDDVYLDVQKTISAWKRGLSTILK